LATHGLYGLLWVIKSHTFPDRQWEQECSFGYGVYIWSGLSLYWITPYLICVYEITAPMWYQAGCVFLFGLGLFWHFTSDMQKHMQLTLQPRLLTDGLWARTRNPNYLGELMIYLGFGLFAYQWAWVPLLVLSLFLAIVWIPNMKKKDHSLSRYPEFETYRQNTGLLFPKIGKLK
jgi:steroid 5-alpha reductase family enzyme